jgi:hypothetical protein
MASLHVDVAWDVGDVVADSNEFETAVVNLVINARDAIPEGGTVTVRARNQRDDGMVAISVEDTGVGIPQDVIDKVFDPFFTTKPVGKGTGLGLSQVHGFAHQAGGKIDLQSTLGKGTTVTIYLPSSTADRVADADGAPSAANGTVLLVEDNPEIADASIGFLTQYAAASAGPGFHTGVFRFTPCETAQFPCREGRQTNPRAARTNRKLGA